MRVLVNGLPFFSRKIVQDLNEVDADNHYVFYDTYSSKWEQIKYLLALPFAGAVISSNGVTDKSKSLDWAIRFKKKLIMQWHGTDVKLAVERHRDGSIDRKYIDYAKHLASAPWFVKELDGVVSEIAYAPFSYTEEIGNTTRYDKIAVLTYLAKGREEFYGWLAVKELAEERPGISITVVGSEGSDMDAPSNVNFLGWTAPEELTKLLENHAL